MYDIEGCESFFYFFLSCWEMAIDETDLAVVIGELDDDSSLVAQLLSKATFDCIDFNLPNFVLFFLFDENEE